MMGGEPHSPWIFLLLLPLVWGEIGPQDCIRFPLISFAHPQVFGAALKTPSLLRIVSPATTPQNGMWMQMEIPVYRSTFASRFFFKFLPGFCYKIQRSSGRGCPVQDQDRFFKLPTRYLPRRMVWFHLGIHFETSSGMGVQELGKWEG